MKMDGRGRHPELAPWTDFPLNIHTGQEKKMVMKRVGLGKNEGEKQAL